MNTSDLLPIATLLAEVSNRLQALLEQKTLHPDENKSVSIPEDNVIIDKVINEIHTEDQQPDDIEEEIFKTPNAKPAGVYAKDLRRLSSSGGFQDKLHAAANTSSVSAEATKELLQLATENYANGDMIFGIAYDYYQACCIESSVTKSITSDSLLAPQKALDGFQIKNLDIIHVATRICKIRKVLPENPNMRLINVNGFLGTVPIKNAVVDMYTAKNGPLHKAIVLQRWQESDKFYFPLNYGLSSMLYHVILCMRPQLVDNDAFLTALRTIRMFNRLDEQKRASSIVISELFESYYQLFETILAMSRILFPGDFTRAGYKPQDLTSALLDGIIRDAPKILFIEKVKLFGRKANSDLTQLVSTIRDAIRSPDLFLSPSLITWTTSGHKLAERVDRIRNYTVIFSHLVFDELVIL